MTATIRRLTAVVAAGACLLGAGAAVATSDADAAARVRSTPTGNATHDDYCRQVADLINSAFAESERQDILGNYDEGQAWWDLGIELLARARDRGCDFSQARVRATRAAVRPGLRQAAAAGLGR
ncbi:MAG: hypothetical protein IRZ32_01105 [Solirubrobacteraceae bacterium]|nr:hypothetical protein [Solirubrobacteraceae bacterium]